MSSCVSGGAAYSLKLETVKSPPLHNTPSPSSTISESNSSPPLAISTRRPRTLRKRPNQTYDEAAALLSTAYPNIFSSKKQKTQNFGIKSPLSEYDEASQFLLPYESIEGPDFVFNSSILIKSDHLFELREVNFDDSEVKRFGIYDDFDAESILDEETEEGINSFMGNIESNGGENKESSFSCRLEEEMVMNPWHESYREFGFAGDFKLGFGLRSSLRENDDGNWWKFPTVDFEQISPRIQIAAVESVENDTIVTKLGDKKRKKTMKKVTPEAVELKSSEDLKSSDQKLSPLYLKLDYDGLLKAWSDKESPFSDEILGSDGAGIDLHARLSEIDLFGESGMREASVLRYKEKRRNRLFSNKIRYQVRKFNADQRPRIKGRFVRRPKTRKLSGLRL